MDDSQSTANPDDSRTAGPSTTSWLFVAFAAGAGTMLFELTAPRIMQPYFGSSSFVWTNVIGVILLALALGYQFGGRLAARVDIPRRVALHLLTAAGCAAIIPWLIPLVGGWLLPAPEETVDATTLRRGLQLGSLVVSLFLFAPPAFLLAAVTPQIVARLASRPDVDAGRAAGWVFGVGTLGSLVGTFLPTYVLIPAVGSRTSLLIAAAFLGLPGAFLLLKGKARVQSAAVLLVVLAASFAGLSNRPLRPALASESSLQEVESSYQYLRIVEADPVEPALKGKTELVLRIDEGVNEFHSLLLKDSDTTGGKYYDTFALLPSFFAPDRKLNIAVLGSGAGTMARLFRTHWNDRVESIINVEIDPAVIALEERFEYRRGKKDQSVALDGRAYLAASSKRYDIVIVDAYARQIDIPFHMVTREFFSIARERLADDGILALNVSGRDLNTGLVQGVGRSLEDGGFDRLQVTPVQHWGNIMLWARPGGDTAWARNETVPQSLQSVLNYAKRFSQSFKAHPDAPALHDLHAPVESLTDEWLKGDR